MEEMEMDGEDLMAAALNRRYMEALVRAVAMKYGLDRKRAKGGRRWTIPDELPKGGPEQSAEAEKEAAAEKARAGEYRKQLYAAAQASLEARHDGVTLAWKAAVREADLTRTEALYFLFFIYGAVTEDEQFQMVRSAAGFLAGDDFGCFYGTMGLMASEKYFQHGMAEKNEHGFTPFGARYAIKPRREFLARVFGLPWEEVKKESDEDGGRRLGGHGPQLKPEAVVARHKLDRVVLAPEEEKRVKETLAHIRHAELLFGKWGLGKTMSYGRGNTIILSGPPGTGKTLLAEAIAGELDQPLVIARYSELVSMWVGETGKNIVSVFKFACAEGAVLVLDEADAICGRRTGVRNSTDKGANQETNILLQEIERFEGTVILTTNNTSNMDPALERRMATKITLEAPGPAERERIWRATLPETLPLAPDVDLRELAGRWELTGGQIKNTVLAAARTAVMERGEETQVTMEDLSGAAERESRGWHDRQKAKIGFMQSVIAG